MRNKYNQFNPNKPSTPLKDVVKLGLEKDPSALETRFFKSEHMRSFDHTPAGCQGIWKLEYHINTGYWEIWYWEDDGLGWDIDVGCNSGMEEFLTDNSMYKEISKEEAYLNIICEK